MQRIVFDSPCLPSQRRFHESPSRFVGFSGPVGSGKTFSLVGKALRMAAVNRGRVGLLGAPTFPMLRDVTLRTLVDELENRRIPYDFHRQEMAIRLRRLGSTILLRSLKDYERLRGTNLAWFGIDEMSYSEEEAWTRLEARLRDPKATRLHGFGVWTPKGFDWVYERFIGPDRRPGYEAIIAAPGENLAVLSANPEFYEVLKNSYDEKFYRQEVLGEYLDQNAGAVYYAYDETAHDHDDLPYNPHAPLAVCMDFNIDPMAWVLAQHGNGKVRALDEITLRAANTVEACRRLVDRIQTNGWLSKWREHQARPMDLQIYGDAAGEQGSTSGQSDYDLVKGFFRQQPDYKLYWNQLRSNPLVKDRVASTNAMLRNAAGDVRLIIDRRCKRLRVDLRRCVWKEGSEGHELDKKVSHENMSLTHHSDALGYLIWSEYRVEGFIRQNSHS